MEEDRNEREQAAGKSNNNGNGDRKDRKLQNRRVAFYKLFSFADKIDVALMIVGSIAAVATGLVQPLMTVIFGQVINSFSSTRQSEIMDSVSKLALKMFYLAIGSCIVAYLQVSCWMVTGERQSARIRCLYLKAILRQDIGFFDTETTTGEVIGRMSGDTILIQDAMGEKVGKFIQFLSTFIGGFIIGFTKGWRLAGALVACIPLLVLFGAILAIITMKMSSRGQHAYAEAGNVVEQTVGAIRTVASFTGEKIAIEKYNAKLKVAYKAAVQQGFASGFGYAAILFTIFSSYGFAVWYGSKLIIEEGYNGGQVITVIIITMNGGMSLSQIAPCLNAFAAGQAAACKMFKTIKRKPNIDPHDMNGIVLEDVNGDIELKDLYFRYPARPDVQIFSGFSMQVPSGGTAALVGQSGSGKSTVISLIERFYDPDSGEVLIDGVDLKKLQLSWIREKIGLVSQEPILFAASIKENIAYGKENATDQEIRTAIELANAAKFIDKMPQLSGGQKQRIAIARAILKNPKILLLDEATSALDSESERIVQDALVKVMFNRTTLVVAHRLTTIRNADIIAVLHMGKIVEKGNHEELIQNPEGAYSQLACLQEGVKESEDSKSKDEDKLEITLDTDKSASISGIQRLSDLRSVSRGSSDSKCSFTVGTPAFGIPASVGVHDTEIQDQSTARKEKPKEVSLKRLASLNKPEVPVLLLGTVAAMANGSLFPVFALLLSSAIHMFYEPPRELRKDSSFWSLLYVGLGCVSFLILPVQNYFFGIAGAKLIERIRSWTFEKVVHQEVSWFDNPENSSGAVGARLSSDASILRSLVGDALALIVQNITTAVAGIIIAFVANWILTLCILPALPVLYIQGHIQANSSKGFSADAKVMYEEASQVANDAVGSIRTVASFCAEKKVMDLYEKKCDGPVKQGIRHGLVSGSHFGVSYFLLYSTNALIYFLGSILVKHGKATFGEVFKVFLALSISAFGVTQSMAQAPDNTKAKDSAASIFAILDRKSKMDSSSTEGIIRAQVNGDIRFEHVTFKYPTRPNVQIFKDLSLSIPSGKTAALVGESGSGKSTVISLIERFYDPDSGHVYLDNVEIEKLKLSWLRQQMGLVSQEPTLFNETIWTNIAYGKQGDVSEEEIISATKAANAHNFVSSLPQGYNTSVSERGVQLSGGQKQRIAIARAIVKNPKILLLDEATSALDVESERVVQDALDRVMVNRTTVVVAHRLATIKNADVIAVVKNGEIAEKGRHDTLMQISDGAYASLVSLHMSAM